jgi:hypothetical protein
MSILFNFLISPRQSIFKGSFQVLDMLTKPETNFFKFISHNSTKTLTLTSRRCVVA